MGVGEVMRAPFVRSIDPIDRLPDGSIEVIDYKTGRAKGQAEVDASLQRTGVPSRLMPYFTESAPPGEARTYCDYATLCPERVS